MRETPAVASWTAYAATQPHLSVRAVTRNSSAGSSQAAARVRGGYQQTRRTPEQQAAYRKAYHCWYSSEVRRLDSEASSRLSEYVALLLLPLAPSSASGEFSDYEQLMLEFSTQLPSKARPLVVWCGVSGVIRWCVVGQVGVRWGCVVG